MNIIEKIEQLKEFDTQYQNMKGVRSDKLSSEKKQIDLMVIRNTRQRRKQRVNTAKYYNKKKQDIEILKEHNLEKYNEIKEEIRSENKRKYYNKKAELENNLSKKAYLKARQDLKKLEKKKLHFDNIERPTEGLLIEIQNLKQLIINYEDQLFKNTGFVNSCIKEIFGVNFNYKSIGNE